jgi:hypothetical protein
VKLANVPWCINLWIEAELPSIVIVEDGPYELVPDRYPKIPIISPEDIDTGVGNV